jgi:myo-inositol-1(or 4)-monophosphatase
LPERDLALLLEAARAAGEIAIPYWNNAPKTWEKDDGAGPVTEADLAVNDMLHQTLRTARPDYGWLSEETEDDTARLDSEHVFIIDPIDGTRSFIAGEKTWAHSLAVARNGQIVAGVIYLPLRDKMYHAHHQGGAYLNGAKIRPSARTAITDASVLASRSNFDAANWVDKAPPVKRHFRPSLAYRMALVAEGRFDAMLTLRDTWEWDVAAGALIVAEAGACVCDRLNAAPVFNNRTPSLAGMVAGGRDVHAQLLDGLA